VLLLLLLASVVLVVAPSVVGSGSPVLPVVVGSVVVVVGSVVGSVEGLVVVDPVVEVVLPSVVVLSDAVSLTLTEQASERKKGAARKVRCRWSISCRMIAGRRTPE
jgi:hypothetical protein